MHPQEGDQLSCLFQDAKILVLKIPATPEQLVELHGAVADYSGNADFYSRTAAIAALLESDVKDRIL